MFVQYTFIREFLSAHITFYTPFLFVVHFELVTTEIFAIVRFVRTLFALERILSVMGGLVIF
jgi:hypothetical protein